MIKMGKVKAIILAILLALIISIAGVAVLVRAKAKWFGNLTRGDNVNYARIFMADGEIIEGNLDNWTILSYDASMICLTIEGVEYIAHSCNILLEERSD